MVTFVAVVIVFASTVSNEVVVLASLSLAVIRAVNSDRRIFPVLTILFLVTKVWPTVFCFVMFVDRTVDMTVCPRVNEIPLTLFVFSSFRMVSTDAAVVDRPLTNFTVTLTPARVFVIPNSWAVIMFAKISGLT